MQTAIIVWALVQCTCMWEDFEAKDIPLLFLHTAQVNKVLVALLTLQYLQSQDDAQRQNNN